MENLVDSGGGGRPYPQLNGTTRSPSSPSPLSPPPPPPPPPSSRPPPPTSTLQRISEPRRTNALFVFTAILCAVLAVAVIIAGALVIAVYLAYRPKVPYVKVAGTHLDRLGYDQWGHLEVVMTIDMEAANDNTKSTATFSDVEFDLLFGWTTIERLRAGAFDVPKKSTLPLHYLVVSSGAPLDDGEKENLDEALRRDRVVFELRGQARTRWRVGVLPTVKLWTHLGCKLQNFFSNGSSINLDCTSKSH